MIKLDYPANVQMFMGAILRVISAETFDPNILDQVVFDYTTDVMFVEEAIVNEQPMLIS